MFVNDYLEFKSKARKEIKDVVFKAIEIYKVLEYKKIDYYSYSMEKSMDIVDKYSFATLIAILDSDKKLNDYLEKKAKEKYNNDITTKAEDYKVFYENAYKKIK